jgi:hypothetical protein
MKWLRFALVFALIGFVISCYEVNEEVVINENGSGVYESRIDMSKLIELMQSFAGEEELTKNGLDRPIDTVISMQTILDSADEATRKENAWMKDGKMFFKLNIKEKLFNIRMNIPYQKLEQLESLMEGQGTLMKNSFSGLMKTNKQPEMTPDSSEATFQDMVSMYKVTMNNGLIKKELDTIKFKQLMARPQAADIKQMAAQGMEMMYTTSFKLPRPVKSTGDHPLLKVSEDKRTVQLRYNLLDIVNDPNKYSFTIEY